MPDEIEEITWPRRSLGKPDITFRVKSDGSAWLLTYRRSAEYERHGALTVLRLVRSVDGLHYIGYERIVAEVEDEAAGRDSRHSKKVAAWEIASEDDLFLTDYGLRQLVDFEELGVVAAFLAEVRLKLREPRALAGQP